MSEIDATKESNSDRGVVSRRRTALRMDGPFTDGAREYFLQVLAETGSVLSACRKAKVGRTTVYEEKNRDEGFAAKWRAALAVAVARFENEAIRRSVRGWDEPVFHEGVIAGYKRKFDGKLLVHMLRVLDPDRHNIAPPPAAVAPTNVTVNIVNTLENANAAARERAISATSIRPTLEPGATRSISYVAPADAGGTPVANNSGVPDQQRR